MMGYVSTVLLIKSAFALAACRLRLARRFCMAGMLAASAPVGFAYADSLDDSLRVYAINIMMQHAGKSWTNSGIYLGNGLVVTAAHVVGPTWSTSRSVHSAGLDLPTKMVKEGAADQVDLALLSVDKDKLPISLQMRRMPLCENAPWPGEPVIVAVPESTARSRIISPQLLPPRLRTKYATMISDVATTGNSGAGVFDAWRKCLLGIMTRKIQVRLQNNPGSELKDLGKYFVPAATIRAFISR
jgi:Trypsin-like peptidase domain